MRTRQILGLLWMLLSGFLCGRFALKVSHDFEADKFQSTTRLLVAFFFGVLYSASLVGSFFLFRDKRWARIVMLVIALVYALLFIVSLVFGFISVLGFLIGVFAVTSVGILFSRGDYTAAAR